MPCFLLLLAVHLLVSAVAGQATLPIRRATMVVSSTLPASNANGGACVTLTRPFATVKACKLAALDVKASTGCGRQELCNNLYGNIYTLNWCSFTPGVACAVTAALGGANKTASYSLAAGSGVGPEGITQYDAFDGSQLNANSGLQGNAASGELEFNYASMSECKQAYVTLTIDSSSDVCAFSKVCELKSGSYVLTFSPSTNGMGGQGTLESCVINNILQTSLSTITLDLTAQG